MGFASQALADAYVTYAEGCFNQFSVHAMLQDKRGFLWFCTQDGLVRHDGAHWRTINTEDGLVHPHLWATIEDPNEPYAFWLGTAGAGVSRYRPDSPPEQGGFTTFSPAGLGDEVHGLCFDDNKRLWTATNTGVSVCDVSDAGLTPRLLDATAANCIVRLKDNRIAAGLTSGTVVIYDGATAAELSRIDNPGKGGVTCIVEDPTKCLWAGLQQAGVLRVEANGTRTLLGTNEGLAHPRVAAALCDSEGDLWFCTWGGGVSRAKQRQFGRRMVFTTITQKDGLGANAIQSAFEDRDKRLWFGTVGAGATCMTPGRVRRPKYFQNFSTREGLGNNMVACIAQDPRDRFWFGCFSGGVTSYDPMSPHQAWRNYGTKEGLSFETVRCVAYDSRERLWFATPGGGLTCYDPGPNLWKHVRVKDGLASDVTRWITPTKDGMFWVATDAGVTCFDPVTMTGFKTISVAEGLLSPSIMHVFEDGEQLWFVYTTSGVSVYDRKTGTLRHYTEKEGLPSNHSIMMTKDKQGRYWFATNGEGVACLDGDKFRAFQVADGMPHNVVYSVIAHVTPTGEEQIWGSTVKGVFRITGAPGAERIMSFDRSDGLGGDECNGRAFLRDRTGRLWFGNTGGASWISANDVPSDAGPCGVFVTSCRSRALDSALKARPLDAPGTRLEGYEFLFEYTAVEYVSPHKIEYRFRLRGLEEAWVRRTSERSVRYTNLKPGAYVFEVQARNWTGAWSASAELSFSVE